jgi:hypothetical protein
LVTGDIKSGGGEGDNDGVGGETRVEVRTGYDICMTFGSAPGVVRAGREEKLKKL